MQLGKERKQVYINLYHSYISVTNVNIRTKKEMVKCMCCRAFHLGDDDDILIRLYMVSIEFWTKLVPRSIALCSKGYPMGETQQGTSFGKFSDQAVDLDPFQLQFQSI